MQKPTLYLIRGLPGSGKSTFASILQSSHHSLLHVVEADDYFYNNKENVYKFDAFKLKDAHHWAQNKTETFLINRESVAVSNTSTTEKEVKTYAKIAKDCDAHFISIIVENRHGGINCHNVPDEAIERMRNRFSIKL